MNDYIEINPDKPAKGSVIWLHGLGADGNDFVPIVSELNLPLRFVFPHAPMRPVTLNQGFVMRAWFDLIDLHFDKKDIDLKGIDQSVSSIFSLIEKEKQSGTPAEKIFLAGFSQGAVIALVTALRYPNHLAGVLALSGCMPFMQELLQHSNKHHQEVPIFLAHGTKDTLVPYSLGLSTYEALKKNNYPVEWHSYDMGHGVSEEEISDIRDWFEKILGPSGLDH